ncbi:MAG: UbiX family flavin prenyltransferase [Methanomicrobiales archaeon]|nr:UbiX family flavin prenyltransferase [Methanomicrobiales archaeon]
MAKKRYVVGITGASGIIYARRLLEVLCEQAEVYIIITEMGRRIAEYERIDLSGFPAVYEENSDMFAEIASGSFKYDGMIILPCSMKTLASIAAGVAGNLLTRTADVCLKERRACILMLREMPLSRIHLKNMLAADEAGATVMVTSPGFYTHPKTIEDLVDMVVARALDHLGVEHALSERWSGHT